MISDLTAIYQRIEYLRSKGVKMKEIADHIGMIPSVLSSLYTTVLPAYLEAVKTSDADEALDYALSQVNNISRRRLLPHTDEIRHLLEEFEPESNTYQTGNPFGEALAEGARNSVREAGNYSGIYMSYSLSSSSDALKIEPILIATAENGEYIRIGRLSAYRSVQWGSGIINNQQTLYVAFSETTPPQLNLVTYYLQLPFREKPHLLRGLYMALDYNRNPIARRIVLIKQSDSTSTEEFLNMKSGMIPKEQLSPEQEIYYQYTCQNGDYIRMCTVPSPHLDESDLEREKKMLEI